MKKSLLAIAAVTAFAGAAQAQSSVTVYGRYDGGLLDTKTTTKTAAGGTTSVDTGTSGNNGNGSSASSLFGFRGVEDLGGGTSAIFNLEYAIAPDTGILDNAGARTSIVGLSDKQLGSIAIGRQLVGQHDIVAGQVWGGNNMVGDLTYSSVAGGTGYATNSRIYGGGLRADNLITYRSPSLVPGLAVRVDYQAERAQDATNGSNGAATGLYNISGSYNFIKVLTARAGYLKSAVNATGVSPTITTAQAYSIAYADKGFTAQLTYADNRAELQSTSAQTSKAAATKLSVMYKYGKFTPFAQYGQGKTQTGLSGAADADTTAYQAGIEYAMSKRSSLYAAYGMSKVEVKTTTTAAYVGNSLQTTQMALGLRHTF
jgi:predicted porin